ncbi:MAG: histidinol-phosphate transaminase [Clostridia bacterium]|nr:histidinol-phosphate transaminase [Clostridia bacterium]
MSKYLSKSHSKLSAYVPGEQPRDRKYIKLNTNESPFPPSPYAMRLARQAAGDLNLYPDPNCTALKDIAAEKFGVEPENIIFTNSSDETLNFAFSAFCDSACGAAFPDITYGFYKVFAELYGVEYTQIPLDSDLKINVSDYIDIGKTVFIANPNAPTGILLSLAEIEQIAAGNMNNVVVIDEAYIDFGGESAIPLISKYDNLLVVRTFSKSRSLAGGRLGFAVGSKDLIEDLNTIKYSTNPYCVNRMSMAAGQGALLDEEYFKRCVGTIIENREYTVKQLKSIGFSLTDSAANFVFAKHGSISGNDLYRNLKEKGILVRYFDTERLKDYVRITIGSIFEMNALIEAIREIV